MARGPGMELDSVVVECVYCCNAVRVRGRSCGRFQTAFILKLIASDNHYICVSTGCALFAQYRIESRV
jgi:hypothetical protein